MSGRFIVLEGPDGSGTTTHTALLAQRLQTAGNDVLLTREPTAGPIGSFIRQELKNGIIPPLPLQLLFSADRAWHEFGELVPALEAEKTVICDRYWLSTVVYAKALGIDPEPLKELNQKFVQPTVQIILLPPFDICMERLGLRADHDMLEKESIQRRVYDGYREMAEKLQIPVIDSSGDAQDVADKIAEEIGR